MLASSTGRLRSSIWADAQNDSDTHKKGEPKLSFLIEGYLPRRGSSLPYTHLDTSVSGLSLLGQFHFGD